MLTKTELKLQLLIEGCLAEENTTYINYLIEISKSGRQRGYLDLCEIIIPNIFTVVYRLVNDLEMAKKLTIKALMQGWMEIKTLDSNKPFVEWIKNIAIGCSMEKLIDNNLVIPMMLEQKYPDSAESDLESAIKSLPAMNRVIFVLHDLEGFSYQEINQFFPELIYDELKTNLIQTRQYLIGSITR